MLSQADKSLARQVFSSGCVLVYVSSVKYGRSVASIVLADDEDLDGALDIYGNAGVIAYNSGGTEASRVDLYPKVAEYPNIIKGGSS